MRFNPRRELARFLAEDIGSGDATSRLLPRRRIDARIVAREPGIVAGAAFAKQLFEMKGSTAVVAAGDGTEIDSGDTVLDVSGTALSVLSCERTALNLLSRMSGIATLTRDLAGRISGSGAEIFATRKTAPGLRYFDKVAVEIGGGRAHRMALDDMVMIKDNHIAAGYPLEELVSRAKGTGLTVEVEVESRQDAILAAGCGADIIMLDNFSPEEIAGTLEALGRRGLRDGVRIEASGGITPENIERYARTGVDMVSLGALTSSVRGIDFSLEV